MCSPWRFEPAISFLFVQLGSRQRSCILGSSLSSPLSYSTMMRVLSMDTGRESFLLMLGFQVQFRRKFCCCSIWDQKSPRRLLSELNDRNQVVVRQQQNLPRITVYNNSNNHEKSHSISDKNDLYSNETTTSLVSDKRQHRLSGSSQRLIEANEKLERAIKLAALDYHHSEHYDHSLYGLNPALDRAVGLHQRETMLYNQDRHLKEEQAKLVAPNTRQSPIAIMTMNPTYELQNKPLIIEYPATLENLRLNNTGFSWEVKIPYQISMTTALYGAHLNTTYRYRLDQFHCHWGLTNDEGSEHTVDNKCYSAELHFVHYNMEKYHTMAKAARHPDGLVVVSVFLEAQAEYRNHAELEKIVSQLKSISLKGEHAIIRQAVRIENLLPTDKSYWSYQGSLTTPPYFESVTWFVLKHPIKCSAAQIQKFRNLRSSLSQSNNNNNDDDDDDDEVAHHIRSNHRKTQPLNGRTIVTYDETTSGLLRSSHFAY